MRLVDEEKGFKMRLTGYLAIVTLVLMLPGSLYAEGRGTTGAQFLTIGVGARATGMGGAYCAVANDALAIHWNPAGLVRVEGNEATFTHLEWFEGIKYEFLGYAQSVGESGCLGAAYYLLHMGEITKTVEDAWGLYAGEAGTFTARDQALTISYSHGLTKTASLGTNVKVIRRENAGRTAGGYAFDIGCLYTTPVEGLNLGLNVQNIGPRIKFIDQKDRLPLTVKAGCAYSVLSDGLTVAVDCDLLVDHDANYHVGLEYWVRGIIALRTGYDSRIDNNHLGSSTLSDGPSIGFGIILKSLQLDAGYVPFGDLGHTYSASLLVRFGGKN